MLALQQWKAARAHLAEAAQAFLTACNTLDESVSGISVDPQVREKTILDVYDELSAVESIRNSLLESCAIVNRISNMSAKHVPANALPPEIMTQIFIFATASSVCTITPGVRKIGMLSVVTSVCSRWRQIAITAGTLWSHVDIILDRNEYYMFTINKLRLERARGVPLHLHAAGDLRDGMVSDGLSTIVSHLPHIRSITLTYGCQNMLAEALLSQCALLCPPGSLDTISCFQLINTTYGNMFELPLGQFRGLVHLKIEECALGSEQFLQVLSNNPSLRSLHLRDANMNFTEAERYSSLCIVLPNLELLDLVGASSITLQMFLSSLSLGPHFVEVRLGYPYDLRFFEILICFARRTNAASVYLRLWTRDLSHAAPLLISLLPSLRALFLDFQEIGGQAFELSALATSVIEPLAAHSQNLHTIGLMSSIVDSATMALIAELPGFGPHRQILFVNCGVDLPEDLAQLVAPSLARKFDAVEIISETKTWLSIAQAYTTERIG